MADCTYWCLFAVIFTVQYQICKTQNLPTFQPTTSHQVDPCVSHTRLLNASTRFRSVAYTLQPNALPLCDSQLKSGWYRFLHPVGYKMPEDNTDPMKNPQQDQCGTLYPIWLGGKHPVNDNEVVTYQACINILGVKNCLIGGTITVKKCNGYYVYKLARTIGCPMAYCAGTKIPCPPNTNGTLKSRGCKTLKMPFDAKYMSTPVVDYDREETNPKVTLYCKVDLDQNVTLWKNVSYEFEWFVNGISKRKSMRCNPPNQKSENDFPCPGKKGFNGTLRVPLPANLYKLGDYVSCNVGAAFTNTINTMWRKKESEDFYAGIKVSPGSLTVQKCSVQSFNYAVTIQSTIPVRAPVNVEFRAPPEIFVDDCNIQLFNTEKRTIHISAECTSIPREGQRQLYLLLQLHSQDTFWSQHLPAIKINVMNTQIRSCSSVTDPHYRPFDYNWHSYSFMGFGTFILCRNAKRYFEVQTKTWYCSGAGSTTCNCGVVIRDHNDVIEFNCCNDYGRFDRVTPLRKRILSKGRLAGGTSITQSISGLNCQFVVTLPSGYRVTVTRNEWGIDVHIDAPNLGTYDGLCGNFNGRTDDDNHARNGNKFRQVAAKSLFYKLPHWVEDKSIQQKTCKCATIAGTAESDCKLNVIYGGLRRKRSVAIRKQMEEDNEVRRRREIRFTDNPTDEDFDMFMKLSIQDLSDARKRSKRSEWGTMKMSIANATRYCNQTLWKSKVTKLCKESADVGVDNLISQCITDVAYTGDKSFAIAIFSILMRDCEENIIRNTTVSQNETIESKPQIAENKIVETIVKAMCPNDCTFNGNCSNGTCLCHEGFTAEDCSISLYNPPEIYSIQSNGLCDKRQRPCRRATIFGMKFLESSNLTCHIEELKVTDGPWVPNTKRTKYKAAMTDLTLVECQLPESPVRPGYFHKSIRGTPASGLCVTVSNDGKNPGIKSLKMITYDSACQRCNISSDEPCKGSVVATGECVIKPNSCLINGYCFAEGDPNPTDWCHQCISQDNITAWTKRKVNRAPTVTTPKVRYALQGENLSLLIETNDTEGRPVQLTLLPGFPQGSYLTSLKMLHYTPKDYSVRKFTFKATDECNASSTADVDIHIVICPCLNGGKCIPHPRQPRGSGIYVCDCAGGYTGSKCETDIDECQSAPCILGTCRDRVNNYSCNCPSGFTGRNCDVNIDDCNPNPCANGNCVDFVNDFKCTCHPGFIGPLCDIDNDECLESPCKRGKCVDGINKFTCVCPPGYTGKKCEVDIDECISSPCIHGDCSDVVNGFSCKCFENFVGPICETKKGVCTNGSCYAGVNCTNVSNGFRCGACPVGMTGDGINCTEINECSSDPCGNGGTCTDKFNNFTCSCVAGFTGRTCKIDINECLPNPCVNNGTCIDRIKNYTCSCAPGFTGRNCTIDINECLPNPCVNQGMCIDRIDNYTCSCAPGFTGQNCTINTNECLPNPCINNGTCIDRIDNYTCSCAPGFNGRNCSININECLPNPCVNNGTCIDRINNYTCSCAPGFTGRNCTIDINECLPNPCVNNGTCIDRIDYYTCSCAPGFNGRNCTININDCYSAPCENGGTCIDGDDNFSCSCLSTYTGKTCDTALETTTLKPPSTVSTTARETQNTTTPKTERSLSTSSKKPTEKTKIQDLDIEIKLNEDWKDELEDKTSSVFNDIAKTIEEEIYKSYSGTNKTLKNVEVISFRKGSIVAELKLTFETPNTAATENLLTPLKNNMKDGRLGQLKVDSNYLKIVDKEKGSQGKNETISVPIIIAIAVGGVAIFIIIAATSLCMKRRNDAKRRANLKKLRDAPPPFDEKFEMVEGDQTLKSTEKLCTNP